MMNFLRKHWCGEYSLPRSYWLHGSLLGIPIAMGGAALVGVTESFNGTSYAAWFRFACLFCMLFVILFMIWSTGGTWRSATYRGGFWAGMAKLGIIIGWLMAISQTVQGLTPKQDHRATRSPMTIEQQAALTADMMSKTPRSELIDKLSVYVDNGTETRSWGRVKDWAIRVEDNLCYIYTAYPEGYILRVGVREQEGYYLMFTNMKWIQIEEDQNFDIDIRFGNQSPWHLTTTAVAMPHSPVKPLAGVFDHEFLAEMASQPTMSIIQEERVIATLDLSDVKPALQSMSVCQEAQHHNPLNHS